MLIKAPLFILSLKRFILICTIWTALTNAADYDGSDYDYEYYNDYDQFYDSDDLDTQAEFNEYYDDSERTQARSKKDTGQNESDLLDNKTLVKLAATECGPGGSSKQANKNCAPLQASLGNARDAFRPPAVSNDQEAKAKDVRNMVQRLYVAQARVQLEASEIKKAQAIANEAQQQLEEAANHVRAITAALQNAQQEVASSAIRAQTAQLQLAAHDQLLFAARQDVDALSSQMVGLQAAEGIAQPKASFDIGALMEKLRQPLLKAEKPTPVPVLVPGSKTKKEVKTDDFYDDNSNDY